MISAIVPTIGRPASLRRLLESLARQDERVDEVVVADGSDGDGTRAVVEDARWAAAGLRVRRVAVSPPHAVRQREAAIAASSGDWLLLLDDDVELEPACVRELARLLRADATLAAACADFSNQSWPMPTRAWRFYLRHVAGLSPDAWQGRVVGPLLRFGFDPVPASPRPIEWLGTGNSLVRRDAFERSGGFSRFFLHRSTINEDVDLGLRLARVGGIRFCPAARMAHHHDAGGRVSPGMAAEDDLHNRYQVMRHTQARSPAQAFRAVLGYFLLETASNAAGSVRRLRGGGFGTRLAGRLRALARIASGRAGGGTR